MNYDYFLVEFFSNLIIATNFYSRPPILLRDGSRPVA